MSNLLPTIVLVHGAWHTPANYSPFISALQRAGFEVHCPHLPSCSSSRPPPAGFPDDVSVVRTLLISLIDAGKTVLMVMHSYGGAVGSSALAGLDLSISARKKSEKAGGVRHLVYLCAFILEAGQCLWDIVQAAKYEELFALGIEVGEDGSTFPRDPRAIFFNGVNEAQTEAGIKELVRFPMSALHAKMEGDVGREAWVQLPSTYVYTSDDFAAPGVYQTIMMEKVKERGVEVREVRVESGHSVFLEKGEEMVAVVVGVAGGEDG